MPLNMSRSVVESAGDALVTRIFAMNSMYRIIDVLFAQGVITAENAAAIHRGEAKNIREEANEYDQIAARQGFPLVVAQSAERIAVWLEQHVAYYENGANGPPPPQLKIVE